MLECSLVTYLTVWAPQAAHADKRIVQLSCYVAERMLQEQPMLSYLPSIVACRWSCRRFICICYCVPWLQTWSACLCFSTIYSCIWVARKNLNRNPWSKTLEKYSHYTEEELQPCLQVKGWEWRRNTSSRLASFSNTCISLYAHPLERMNFN